MKPHAQQHHAADLFVNDVPEGHGSDGSVAKKRVNVLRSVFRIAPAVRVTLEATQCLFHDLDELFVLPGMPRILLDGLNLFQHTWALIYFVRLSIAHFSASNS